MKKKILQSVEEGMRAVAQLRNESALTFIEDVSHEMKAAFQRGNKLLLAGNGGSLCDANHFAEELTGYFRKKRPALPAIALSEPGHLTCVGNDAGFETVFSRGVEALGKEGDLFFGLTTSGNSENLVRAFEAAKALGLVTVSFLGKGGGRLLGVADYSLVIGEVSTSDRIQEAHMTAIHILIERVEALLFGEEEAEVERTCLAAL